VTPDSASAAQVGAATPKAQATRYGGSHSQPRDVAKRWVQDQLSGVALDSAHCLSPRAIHCAGPIAVVSDLVRDSGGWSYRRGATRPRLAARLVALYFELPSDAARKLAE